MGTPAAARLDTERLGARRSASGRAFWPVIGIWSSHSILRAQRAEALPAADLVPGGLSHHSAGSRSSQSECLDHRLAWFHVVGRGSAGRAGSARSRAVCG